MKTIWEFLHENAENIRYQQTEYFSPYYEVSKESLKIGQDKVCQVSFNAFYRYEEVFEALFDMNIKEEYKKFLFDCMLHYLVCQEFQVGVTKGEYKLRYYWKDMEEGRYGEQVKTVFTSLPKEKKHFLARTLYQQNQIQASVYLFANSVTKMLTNCVVYRNKIEPTVILVYIQEKNSSYHQKILMVLKELFLPLNYTMRIFNEKHFGVIGAEQTMETDEIEIF